MRIYQDKKQHMRNVAVEVFGSDKSYTDAEISVMTGYSESWVKQLRRKFGKMGSALSELHKPSGAIPKITPTHLEDLKGILDKGALANGFEGSYWSRARVQQVLKESFNLSFSLGHVGVLLRKINYTVQKPRKKDFRQDTEKVEIWKSETLPEIKKK